jgi:hypothetical protein
MTVDYDGLIAIDLGVVVRDAGLGVLGPRARPRPMPLPC